NVLQLVLDPRPHPYQMLAMNQQLPQVPFRHRRDPDLGKAIFHHQLQNQLRCAPVMLLLPPILPGDRSCIPDPQLVPIPLQPTLKPSRAPTGLDAYQHWLPPPFVENPRFLGMQQPALDQLARLHVQHCYLLEARMKVTAYILHIRPPSSRALRSLANRVYSRLLGAVGRHPINRSATGVLSCEETEGAEWRDPERVSFAMLPQGVLPRLTVATGRNLNERTCRREFRFASVRSWACSQKEG